MTFGEGLLIFLAILGIYTLAMIILYKSGLMKKHNLSFYGPALMWRTNKGKNFINRVSKKKKFWLAYANVGIVACFILMILMLLLLISTFPIAIQQEDTIVSSHPEIALGLPGLNPIIPLGYGIIAFVIALVVHEFSHGILTSAQKLKIKSLGILYFIIPIGAFCEPDEEKLKKASNKKRMRVFAAGPTANLAVAFICLAICSIMIFSCVQPAADGVGVFSVGEGMPAEELGLEQGMIITSINGSEVTDIATFEKALDDTSVNQTVEITYVSRTEIYTGNVKLTNKYQIYYNAIEEEFGEVNSTYAKLIEKYRGKGYLGVSATTQFKSDINILKNPFSYFPFGFIYYIGMPMFGLMDGYSALNEPFSDFYVVNGLPQDTFWIVVNIFYWIFWFNLMVAMFNVLPMIPLDGGYMFGDLVDIILKKLKTSISKERREKIITNVSTVLSLFILMLILAPIIVPNIRALF